MKHTWSWLAILIAGMLIGQADFSPDVEAQSTGPRLAYIEIDRVLAEASVFKSKRDELREAHNEAQDQLDAMMENLRAQRQDLEDKKDLMKDSEYYKQRTELEKKLVELRALKQEKEMKLSNLARETLGPLGDKLEEAVENVAKEDGIGFVFKEKNLAYAAAQFDITQKVIDRLNQGL